MTTANDFRNNLLAPIFHARIHASSVQSFVKTWRILVSIIPSIVWRGINDEERGIPKRGEGKKGRKEERKEMSGMDGLSNFWSSEQNAGRHENIRSAWPDKTNIRFGDALRFSPPRKQFWLFLRLRDATPVTFEELSLSKLRHCPYGKWISRGGECISGVGNIVYGNWKSKRGWMINWMQIRREYSVYIKGSLLLVYS